MNIYEADLTKLLPRSFLEDEKARQVAEVVNEELKRFMLNVDLASASYDIDNATEAVLEHIAWQLNSELFFLGTTLEQKKQLVKETIKLHRLKGTKYAVEHAIQLMYPNATVEEWFEYNGNPYYFKVNNIEARPLREILTLCSIINIFKSLRSWVENNFTAIDEGLIDLNLLLDFDLLVTAKYDVNYCNSITSVYTGIITKWEINNEQSII